MYDDAMHEDQCPWYKQLWPWLLISLPASAVFGGIATFILAVNSPNALVADDYYKQGLAINRQTERLRTASELGLEGLLRGDDQYIELELQATDLKLPASLQLELAHATRDELDKSFTLEHIDNNLYRAPYQPLHTGRWYIRLQPEDGQWELRGKAHIDDGLQTRLSGAH
jgi:hypothetical protein